MGEWNLDREYQLLVEGGLASGELTVRVDGPELRRAPRFRFQHGRIAVRVEPEFNLVDLSATGLAFLSDLSFAPETALQVIVKGTVAVQARVVTSTLVETDADLLEMRYRVQCRFDDTASGKHLVLLMKEIDRMRNGGTGHS